MGNVRETIDAVMKSLPESDEPGWDRLTVSQQRFVAMNAVEGQVTNGGFHAVYYNRCQHYLTLAAAGYAAIGAHEQAGIVRNVLDTMHGNPWAGPPETWPDPNAAEPPKGGRNIEDFDDPWYRLDLGVLDARKAQYIETHTAGFPPLGA